MRVAVCVSGACVSGNPKGDLIKNNIRMREQFPTADFYYATWDSYKPTFTKRFPNDECWYFAEPDVLYHPYSIKQQDHISPFYQAVIDWINKGGSPRIEWSRHHTKQIIIHAWLLDSITEQYDVIVRTRFDGFIYKNADFIPFLEDTLTNNRTNCFGTTNPSKMNVLTEIDSSVGKKFNHTHRDQLIIHPASAIDLDFVQSAHESHTLHAAEFGWYQVISFHQGTSHRNFDGWVNHDKRVSDKFLLESV